MNTDKLLALMTSISLLAGIVRYLVGGIMRIGWPNIGVNKDYSNVPTMSILLPCFNEGKDVYDTIQSVTESDYPVERLEIIVTDDSLRRCYYSANNSGVQHVGGCERK